MFGGNNSGGGLQGLFGKKKPTPLSAIDPAAAGGGGGGAPQPQPQPQPDLAPLPPPDNSMPGGIDATSGIQGALAANAAKPQGFFGKVGSALHDPHVKAALLRSAGATLEGGLSAGIKAGTGYYDQMEQQDERKREFELGHDLDKQRTMFEGKRVDISQQGADTDRLNSDRTYELGGARILSDDRHNRATEQLAHRGQNVEMRDQDVRRANNTDDNRVQTYGIDTRARSDHEGHVLGFFSGLNNDDATIQAAGLRGDSTGAPVVSTKVKHPAQHRGWFSGEDVPAYEETTKSRLGGAGAPAAGARPGAGAEPPADAIQALRGNPGLRPMFEQKYGVSADKYLGRH